MRMQFTEDWKTLTLGELYKRLEEIREKSGLNKKDFSTKLGKSLNWYHQCIREHRDLSYSDLKRIEEVYGEKM